MQSKASKTNGGNMSYVRNGELVEMVVVSVLAVTLLVYSKNEDGSKRSAEQIRSLVSQRYSLDPAVVQVGDIVEEPYMLADIL